MRPYPSLMNSENGLRALVALLKKKHSFVILSNLSNISLFTVSIIAGQGQSIGKRLF